MIPTPTVSNDAGYFDSEIYKLLTTISNLASVCSPLFVLPPQCIWTLALLRHPAPGQPGLLTPSLKQENGC